MEEQPKISVVVPVYNGARTIGQAIERLLQQSLPPFEIIVVNDGSTDLTAEVLRSFGSRIVHLPKDNGGPASARNMGVIFAHCEFVAFTDSDCLPDRDWLFNLIRGFDSWQTAGSGGIVRSADGSLTGEYIDSIRLLDPQLDRNGEIPYLITANACFRREVLIRAGLFDESFRKPGGEEAELCFRIRRLGYRFNFVETAVVLHHHRQSIGSLLKTLANYGQGAQMISKIWPDRRIDHPIRMLLRRAVSVRFVARQLRNYARRYDLKRTLYFSLLDYLRQPAFLWGYTRGQRREP